MANLPPLACNRSSLPVALVPQRQAYSAARVDGVCWLAELLRQGMHRIFNCCAMNIVGGLRTEEGAWTSA
jgi:hypothetical protein